MKNVVEVVAPSGRSKKAKEIRYAIDLYHSEHPDIAGEPLAPEVLAAWIEKRHILKEIETDPVEIRTKQIVRYLSREMQTDPQGREVRANAFKVEKVPTKKGFKRRSRWLPLFEAPEDFAKEFFQWRRNGARADLIASETDRESYNDNNHAGGFVPQPSLDFTLDVAEKKLPSTYPSAPPDDEDDEDDKP